MPFNINDIDETQAPLPFYFRPPPQKAAAKAA